MKTENILILLKDRIYIYELEKKHADEREKKNIQKDIELLEECKHKLMILHYMQSNVIGYEEAEKEWFGSCQVTFNLNRLVYEELIDKDK